jgi:iron complex transport system ATP-binding protein
MASREREISEMAQTLKAEGLTLHRGGRTLLKNIGLAVEPGMLTALIGPNGAGKSTLLRCLAGVLVPDAGRVSLNDTPINKLTQKERSSQVSYFPQNLETPFAFTTDELLGLGTDKPVPGDHPALMALEIGALKQCALTTLSGGERQRVAVARALVAPGTIYLLDEPLAHLDLRYVLRLLRYLNEVTQAGAGVVLALHDLRLARKWADRLWLLSDGALLADSLTSRLDESLLYKAFGLEPGDLLNFS